MISVKIIEVKLHLILKNYRMLGLQRAIRFNRCIIILLFPNMSPHPDAIKLNYVFKSIILKQQHLQLLSYLAEERRNLNPGDLLI